MSKRDQNAWNTLRNKLKSSPDYVLVRKTAQANVLAGETKVGNDDYATSYFELNILDLPAGGGGGPAYDDSVIVKDLEDLQTEVDDISAQVDSNTKAIDGFDGGGSCDCDPEEMQADIDANTEQIDRNTKRIFDQSGEILANTTAIESNATAIQLNGIEIQNNADTIRLNTNDLAKNMGAIADNTEQIGINTASVSSQGQDIQALGDELDDKVNISEGQSTLSIWRGTATEYGELVADPDTLYFIIQ